MVIAAGGEPSVEARAALSALCQAYWRPLHGYVLNQGYSAEDALDLTQEFFARLIEKNYSAQADPDRGRFRSFLLGAVKNFLSSEARRAATRKRGEGEAPLPLDFEPVGNDSLSPAQLYERRWALTVIERAMAGLRSSQHFEQLKGYLIGDESKISYGEVAAQLGASEGAVKVKVHRLRRRFGERLRAEIRRTVDSEDKVDEELRYLFEIISR